LTLPVVLALAGCSATEDTDEPATSTGTTTGPTEPAVLTVALTPTVAPATGPMITGPIASLNVPADFNPKGTPRSSGGNISGSHARDNVMLSDRETSIPNESVDYLAK